MGAIVCLCLLLALLSGGHSDDAECPEEFSCIVAETETVVPSSYTIPQGFFHMQDNRSYADHLYTSTHNRPFVEFWNSNGTAKMVWLQNGTGKLLDGKCGAELSPGTEQSRPWVGWDTAYTPRTSVYFSVRLFFYFSKLTTVKSIILQALDMPKSSMAAFSSAVVYISNDSSIDVINGMTQKYPYPAGSGWEIVTFKTFAAPPSLGKASTIVRTAVIAEPRPGVVLQLILFMKRPPKFTWMVLSEVKFCGHQGDETSTPTTMATLSSVSSTDALTTQPMDRVINQVTAEATTTTSPTKTVPTPKPTSTISQTPRVTPRPPPMAFPDFPHDVFDLTEGEPGVVTCRVRNAASLKLYRETETYELANKSASGSHADLAVLWNIDIVKEDVHSGKYRCEAENNSGHHLAHYIMVNVKPAFRVIPMTAEKVPVGGMVLLQCCLEDSRLTRRDSKLRWFWSHIPNGKVSPTIIGGQGRSYLLLVNVSAKDAGSYFCQVSAVGLRSRISIVHLNIDESRSVDPLGAQKLALRACDGMLGGPGTNPTTDAGPPVTSGASPPMTSGASPPVASGASPPVASGPPSDDSMATVTALAIIISLLVVILVLAFVLLLALRRRVQRRKLSYAYTISRVSPSPPSKPTQQHLPFNQMQTVVDSSGYQLMPGEEHSPSPLQVNAPPFLSNTPDIVFSSVSDRSSSSSSSRQPTDVGKHVPIYAEVSCSKVRERLSQDAGVSQDGRAFAESSLRVRHPSSASSADAPPPSLPTRVSSMNSINTVDTRDQPTQEFSLYDDPADCQERIENLKQGENGMKIYEEPTIKPECILATGTSGKQLRPLNAIYEEPPPLAKEDGPPEIDSLQLERKKKIGEGQFGDVFLAMMYFKPNENGQPPPPQAVALKVLKPSAGKELVDAFKKEVKFMFRLLHPNVIRLLGVCSKGQPCMVIEHMENRDLNSYLNTCKLSVSGWHQRDSGDIRFVTFHDLLTMASQVAAGMEYMSQRAFVHRDLAARNCLVDSEGRVKLGDFGLSRHLYEKQYYRVTGTAILPIRWMAPESFYGRFSIQSDVFAFGVTMWEIITLCRQRPFDDLSDNDLIQLTIRSMSANAEASARPQPSIPIYCTPDIEQLLRSCWQQDPDDRPAFSQLNADLERMLK